MAKQTIEQKQRERAEQMEANRALGVIPWSSPEPQSEKVYEVVEGYHHVPGGKHPRNVRKLGPGMRFHPTENQVAKGSLRGKARELTASELAGIGRSADPSRKIRSTGADIGIRDSSRFPLTPGALKLALDQKVTEEELAGVEGEGSEGTILKAQVAAIVAARSGADGEEDAEE